MGGPAPVRKLLEAGQKLLHMGMRGVRWGPAPHHPTTLASNDVGDKCRWLTLRG